jgi:hypothetical protein
LSGLEFNDDPAETMAMLNALIEASSRLSSQVLKSTIDNHGLMNLNLTDRDVLEAFLRRMIDIHSMATLHNIRTCL